VIIPPYMHPASSTVLYPSSLVFPTMDITLLPPSTILSRHSHLALLPSPFPNTPLKSGYQDRFDSAGSQGYPRVPYRLRKRYEPPAPGDGASPIAELPDELMLSIFGYLDWEELVSLRPVSRRWADLAVTPALHTSLTFSSLPAPLPPILRNHLLRSVRHLYLHLFPYPTHRSHHTPGALLDLLEAISPGQLRSLSLPFSAPYVSGRDLGVALRRIGSHLEHLDLKGSGLVGSKWTGWIADLGKEGPGLSVLDLGFTSISSLAIQGGLTVKPFRSMRRLSLASCTYLSESTLSSFLATLPSSIEQLDLSRLDNVSFNALWQLKVVDDEGEERHAQMDRPPVPTKLKEIKVVGIDHLTRRDVRRLKAHWEEQRRACILDDLRSYISVFPIPVRWDHKHQDTSFKPLSPPASPHTPEPVLRNLSPSPPSPPPPHPPFFEGLGRLPTPPRSTSPPDRLQEHTDPDGLGVNIIHSAILESEDEEGYRQFIGEVAGATATPVLGADTGLGLGLYVTSRGAGWVEVDGGGPM